MHYCSFSISYPCKHICIRHLTVCKIVTTVAFLTDSTMITNIKTDTTVTVVVTSSIQNILMMTEWKHHDVLINVI